MGGSRLFSLPFSLRILHAWLTSAKIHDPDIRTYSQTSSKAYYSLGANKMDSNRTINDAGSSEISRLKAKLFIFLSAKARDTGEFMSPVSYLLIKSFADSDRHGTGPKEVHPLD